VDIQSASSEPVPSEEDLHHWVLTAVTGQTAKSTLEVCVRLVDREEMSKLNSAYRGKNGPTNVLSFPADLPPDLNLPLLGDIVICAPVVAAEALKQGKNTRAHWAHMTVHGTLHLLGYDHVEEEDAARMEALESTILAQLNFGCPYESTPPREHISP
jgi:probable rRNA maturation factor